MSPVIISLQDVAVSYREDVALRGISLEINKGELIGIAGPNGSGKTTILTVINGLGRLIHGEVRVLSCLMKASSRGRGFRLSLQVAGLRKKIGYVPQGCPVDPRTPVNVREAVMMGRYGRLGLSGKPGLKDRKLVDSLIELVDLSHLAERPYGHLSGGEQQRVAVGRALAQEPEILLLDEPTTFLDWQSRKDILQLILRVHRQNGLTTLMVTHDPRDTFSICDRVMLLDNGRLAAFGPPSEALSETNLHSVYSN